jgi:hypothetical protein
LRRAFSRPQVDALRVTDALRDRYGDDLLLTFSRYQVGPPGDQESRPRTLIQSSIAAIDRVWLQDQLDELDLDEELALHSSVRWRGRAYHIGMIDYEGVGPVQGVERIGEEVFLPALRHSARRSAASVFTFETGHSFHQYCDVLLKREDWIRNLGDLLIAPEDPGVHADYRWIGHALRKGYAALRWSGETNRYVKTPTLVRTMELRIGVDENRSSPAVGS